MKQSETFITEYQFFYDQYLNIEKNKYKYMEKSNEIEVKLIDKFIEFSKLFKSNDLKVIKTIRKFKFLKQNQFFLYEIFS